MERLLPHVNEYVRIIARDSTWLHTPPRWDERSKFYSSPRPVPWTSFVHFPVRFQPAANPPASRRCKKIRIQFILRQSCYLTSGYEAAEWEFWYAVEECLRWSPLREVWIHCVLRRVLWQQQQHAF